jgi:flagellar basal-body rod protein FlgC
MAIFPVLAISGSGLRVQRTWLDAVADNIANINTVRPTSEAAFQARYVVAAAKRGDDSTPVGVGGGSEVAGIAYGDPNGRLVYMPGHPLADANGLVRVPDMDLGEQMTQLIMAQRGYQMNLVVIDRARETYLQAISINGR